MNLLFPAIYRKCIKMVSYHCNSANFPTRNLCPDARSEDQMSQCVRNGDRPEEDLIPEDTPKEILELMKRCWDHYPQQRPTFKGVPFLCPYI